MKNIIVSIIGVVVSLAFGYGCYYVAKNVSYSMFYEDMVIETINEEVQKKCLKE